MNEQVANIVKLYIKNLPWAQVVVGLAKTASVNTASGDPEAPVFTRRLFPVPCVAPDQCTVSNLPTMLIPDESKRSIIYFEDNGVNPVAENGNLISMVSSLRLVGWINPAFFTSPRCNISTLVIVDILRNLPKSPFNMGGFTRIQIKFKGEEVRSSQSIFGKYSYNTLQHLLMAPYDFFALRIEVLFTVDAACMDDVLINDEPCPVPNEYNPDFDCPDCPQIDVAGGLSDLKINISPAETPNGVITTFTLPYNFVPGSSMVYLNGQRLTMGVTDDYTEIAPNKISFVLPPQTGDVIVIDFIKI